MQALIQQISATEFVPPPNAPYSLYFGGGTPSLLSTQQIQQLVGLVTAKIGFPPIEVTLECNPNLTHDQMVRLQDAGINRISVGIQTTNVDLLRRIDRCCESKNIDEVLLTAQGRGMNVSVDFITGIPGANTDQTIRDISYYTFVDHISLYVLTLSETHQLSLSIDEDFQVECFNRAAEYLQQNGFTWYEISNFAKAGKESFHNSLYWRAATIYAFGPGACGKGAKTRYRNQANLSGYIAANGLLPLDIDEFLSPVDIRYEALILPLRTSTGITPVEIAQQPVATQNQIAALLTQGVLLRQSDDSVIIAPQYWLLYNEIIYRLTDNR